MQYINITMERCMPFDSYIKPQHEEGWGLDDVVVCLLIPTSNHNKSVWIHWMQRLYAFWFLHQTTTSWLSYMQNPKLYAFWFLHQTTTFQSQHYSLLRCMPFDSYIKPQLLDEAGVNAQSCMPFDSYIKPQPSTSHIYSPLVVCLLIPTSNHNIPHSIMSASSVVCLLIPTSNHNL